MVIKQGRSENILFNKLFSGEGMRGMSHQHKDYKIMATFWTALLVGEEHWCPSTHYLYNNPARKLGMISLKL